MECLSSFILPAHVHTLSPRCELCLWLRKTKEKHLFLVPAWLQVRVKDHLSPWELCKMLLWRGPACLQHATAHLPAPRPMLALYLRGLRKPQDYIKHSLSGSPTTAVNAWALKRLQGPALSVKDPTVVGWGQPGALPAYASGKAAWCLMICQGSLPPFLICVTEPVSDAILCLLLLQGQDGPYRKSSVLAAPAGTGLARQQHSTAGLPSKQLQSQGELRQEQGKSSFSHGSVISCLTPLSRLQNLAFSSISVHIFTQSYRLQNSRSVWCVPHLHRCWILMHLVRSTAETEL